MATYTPTRYLAGRWPSVRLQDIWPVDGRLPSAAPSTIHTLKHCRVISTMSTGATHKAAVDITIHLEKNYYVLNLKIK